MGRSASNRVMKNLTIARILKSFSQWDLAGLTGIPNYRISLLETGKAQPKAEELEALAKALETTPELLVDEGETNLKSLVRSQQVA